LFVNPKLAQKINSFKVFNENVKEFIDQIDDLDHINLFLTSLKNYDSTIQIFGANYPERTNEKPSNHKKMEAKINGICEKVRNVLQNIDDPKRKLRFYPAILTTYIEEFPSQISTALINTRDYLAEC
jgi:elongator complex protein 1